MRLMGENCKDQEIIGEGKRPAKNDRQSAQNDKKEPLHTVKATQFGAATKQQRQKQEPIAK